MIKLLCFILISSSMAAQVKMRAREHFEHHTLRGEGIVESYSGLTNTITLGMEKPYDYSYGLSFSPIISSLKASNSDSQFGKNIVQQNVGLYFKYFFTSLIKNLFSRFAFGYSRLEVDKGDDKEFFGSFSYIGLGYEIPFDSFGLALEMGYRQANYNQSITLLTISPSIGFHFYKDF